MKNDKQMQSITITMVEMKAAPEMNKSLILKDLMDNPKLWLIGSIEKSDLWESDGTGMSISMDDYLGQKGKEDTISIVPSGKDDDKLFELMEKWGADKCWKNAPHKNVGGYSFKCWWDRKQS